MSLLMKETGGILSKESLLALSRNITGNGMSYSTNHKYFVYIKNFIKYLSQARDNPSVANLCMYFRMPKVRREIKMMTPRIIVDADIENALVAFDNATLIDDESKAIYKTLTLLLAYSGQRVTTIARITVGQFRKALAQDPPVLTVEAKQDKNRMQHLVPLHPIIIPYLTVLMKDKPDSALLFNRFGLQTWFRRNPISLIHTNGKLELKDLRKYYEQKSDELGFTDAHKNFIMSHGCSSVGWTNYKAFLPENVYAAYMKHWGSVMIE
jgi:integrase